MTGTEVNQRLDTADKATAMEVHPTEETPDKKEERGQSHNARKDPLFHMPD